eukprot:251821_1
MRRPYLLSFVGVGLCICPHNFAFRNDATACGYSSGFSEGKAGRRGRIISGLTREATERCTRESNGVVVGTRAERKKFCIRLTTRGGGILDYEEEEEGYWIDDENLERGERLGWSPGGISIGKAVKKVLLKLNASPEGVEESAYLIPKLVIRGLICLQLYRVLDYRDAATVRLCRVAYALYLCIYQALCASIRVLVWRANDATPVTCPPPKAILGMGEKLLANGQGGLGLEGTSRKLEYFGGQMLTRKETAKQHDLLCINRMRSRVILIGIVYYFTHTRFGWLRPIMISAVVSLFNLVDSPIFKVHVLGWKAERSIARPFQTPVTLQDLLKRHTNKWKEEGLKAKQEIETEEEFVENEEEKDEIVL